MNAVTMNHLSKTYSTGRQAVSDMTITLGEGEIFGFLGPNGAGKTTTVKILNGMLLPSEGECSVFGEDPSKQPENVHALSGVMTEHAQMYNHLTGMQNLLFYASLFGLTEAEGRKRARELLERMNLSEASGQKLQTYSTGMRQRLSIARALIHQPKILFLDEPTSGLDPESAYNVNQMILNLASDKGMTIFLCTHQLRYAQEICTRYGLIDEGRLLVQGTLEELRARVSSGITVRIRTDHMPLHLLKQQPDSSKRTGQCRNDTVQNIRHPQIHDYELMAASEDAVPDIVKQIMENGGSIYHVSAERPALEDIYFSLTSERREKQK